MVVVVISIPHVEQSLVWGTNLNLKYAYPFGCVGKKHIYGLSDRYSLVQICWAFRYCRFAPLFIQRRHIVQEEHRLRLLVCPDCSRKHFGENPNADQFLLYFIESSLSSGNPFNSGDCCFLAGAKLLLFPPQTFHSLRYWVSSCRHRQEPALQTTLEESRCLLQLPGAHLFMHQQSDLKRVKACYVKNISSILLACLISVAFRENHWKCSLTVHVLPNTNRGLLHVRQNPWHIDWWTDA